MDFHGDDHGSPLRNNYFDQVEDSDPQDYSHDLRVNSPPGAPGAVPPEEEEDALADLTPSYSKLQSQIQGKKPPTDSEMDFQADITYTPSGNKSSSLKKSSGVMSQKTLFSLDQPQG